MDTPPQPPAEAVAEHVHALETAHPHGYLEHEIQKHGKAPNLHLKEPHHHEAPPLQAAPDASLPQPDARTVAERVHELESHSPKGYLEHEIGRHHGQHPDLKVWPPSKKPLHHEKDQQVSHPTVPIQE